MPELSLIAALLGGLVVLAVAGDVLVTGAVAVARRLGLSPLIAGIFIVGFGTSLPEMIVAVDAAAGGHPELALGNIVGSNIANVWLVLALPALLSPIACGQFGQTGSLVAVIIATAAWIGLTAVMPLNPGIGVLFIAALVGYGLYTFFIMQRASRNGINVGVESQAGNLSLPLMLLFIAIGLVGLPVGARLIVEGGVGVARAFDISEEVIGLTLLAVGTSLPELGAGIAAALRGKASVMVGNILGSNLFNILGSGGIVALFGPLSLSPSFHNYDHWALGLTTLTLALFILTRSKVSRLAAIAMMLVYALYIYGLISGWDLTGLVLGRDA